VSSSLSDQGKNEMEKRMKRLSATVIHLSVLIIIISMASGVLAQEPKPKNVSGKYIKKTENESANIEVKLISQNKVHVKGIALWGTNRETGPNIGELDFKAPIKNGRVEYFENKGKKQYYKLELIFTEKGLIAKEEGSSDNFGLNVTFAGEYSKQ
jgi:hypothetical protein